MVAIVGWQPEGASRYGFTCSIEWDEKDAALYQQAAPQGFGANDSDSSNASTGGASWWADCGGKERGMPTPGPAGSSA
eukprot:364435-Chlamydomonas_euryale.AAC.2